MISVILMVVAGKVFGLTQVDISTGCTLLLMFVGVMMVARASKPIDQYKRIVIGTCVAGLALAYAIIPAFFGMTRMAPQSWIICGVLASFSIAILRWTTALIDFVWNRLPKSKLIKLIHV